MPIGRLAPLLPVSIPVPWQLGTVSLLLLALLWAVYRRAYHRSRPTPTVGSQTDDANASSGSSSGSVYVLTNPEHPGLVKIGYTTRSVAERARELSSATGVPRPFEVEYEAEVPNPEAVETAVHTALDRHLVNPNREFFDVSVRTAIRTIRRVTDETATGSAQSGLWHRLGLSSILPAGIRSRLDTGLGLVLLAASLIAGSAIVVDGILGTGSPVSWTRAPSAGPRGPDRLGVLGTVLRTVGHALGPALLGYSGLLLVGMGGLWGVALLRHRSLRPLALPTALALLAAPASAALFGWMALQSRAHSPLWTGGSGTADALQPWTGAVSTPLAGGLRAHLGPTGALLLLLALLGGSLMLGVWWAWPRSS